jgi:oligopeptide transport system substrate-binding protein
MQSQWENPDPSAQASVSMTGWGADYPDANNFLADAMRSAPTRWSNASFDTLVARAASTLDPTARNADYADAERILTETDAAIAPMYTIPDAYVRKPSVTVVGDRIENWSVAK